MNSDEYKAEYGFDRVTWQNLLQPAEVMQFFAHSGAITPSKPAPLAHWVELIQSPKMNPAVPKDIRSLYEVAKGCMTYGVLFYPLFSVASEQLFRLYESALKARAVAAGGHKDLHYKDAFKFLVEVEVLSEERRYRWDAVWNLRNSTSHPKMQMILPPGQAVHFLEETAKDIDDLFLTPHKDRPKPQGLKPSGNNVGASKDGNGN